MGLHETLLAPDRRPATIDEFVALVEAEVASKSGLGGAAVKAAFGAATKLNPKIVRRAVSSMLPDFLDGLDPLWAARADATFADTLQSRSTEATDALLSVTDGRAAKPKHASLAKIYSMIRPKAAKHVTEALPRLGRTIEQLMA
jgi:hypothetical protein